MCDMITPSLFHSAVCRGVIHTLITPMMAMRITDIALCTLTEESSQDPL